MPLLDSRPELELVVWAEDRACDRTWLLENIPGATGVIVMLTDKVDSELLDIAGPSLRVVSTMSVGYDHIDLKAAAQRALKVGYTPDVLTDAGESEHILTASFSRTFCVVSDLSVLLALMAGRNGGVGASLVQNGEWPNFSWAPFGLCGPQLSTTKISPTRKIGFLGFGRIAQATLARLVPFGITHCLYSSNPTSLPNLQRDAELAQKHNLKAVKKVDLDELARESDVLFVLAPGGSGTYHVVNEELLRKMKKTGILVNASRGTLVDSDALAKALKEGWIWGAGLDVVEGEPNVTRDHPLVKEPRCVILPHIASATLETRKDMATCAAQNVIAGVLGGEMPAEVDLSPFCCSRLQN
ncbi:D-isomer specific 2-hydroxyacid dehydrogenase [Melanogaster broomeanus]|nr:D-isomer specific 2-hydroxyacid dehydrogenase [Melanogaster broomeanus]